MDAGPGSGLEQNKVEVLRFLLVLLSKQIYSSPAALFTVPSQYSLALVQRTPRRHVLTILCSLMNTAMNSPKPSMPTSAGGAIGSVASSLPYNHLVFKGEDVKELLVSYSMQTICALLDFKSGSAREGYGNAEDLSGSTTNLKTNAFRYFLAKLVGTISCLSNRINNIFTWSAPPVRFRFHHRGYIWDSRATHERSAQRPSRLSKTDTLCIGNQCVDCRNFARSLITPGTSVVLLWKAIDLNKASMNCLLRFHSTDRRLEIPNIHFGVGKGHPIAVVLAVLLHGS